MTEAAARLRIRPAEPRDAALLLAFVRELATYEREPSAVTATVDDYLRDGFGPSPLWKALVAEWDGEPAGFALYFWNWSTWQGRKGLYLEDLFVREALRGNGIGKALLVELARVAVREGCGRFQWQVLDWNAPALEFYRALGARTTAEWVPVRLEGAEIARVAGLSER